MFNYSGDIVAEQSFDAWGRRRNPSNWTYNNIPTVPKWLIRGYTGHEHLEENGLINMNGRMYDPILGRMLSPDNYVQAADFSQNYNRYSYVLNNPLKYNDPSGEIAWAPILFEAAIGGVTNWTANGAEFNARGLMYFGVGALAGATGGIVNQGLSSSVGSMGFFRGAVTGGGTGFVSGFIIGAGNAWVGGADFEQGAWLGLKSGGIGGAFGGLLGGVLGGISAVDHGGDFWTRNGATFDALDFSGINSNQAEGLEYSNDYAGEFSDRNFGRIKKLNKLYADGSLPKEAYTERDGKVFNGDGFPVRGSTVYRAKGKADVYLFKAAFTSKKQLYLTMGHEYLHVGFGSTAILNKARQHAAISKWEYGQAKMWGFEVKAYKSRFFNRSGGIVPYSYDKLLLSNPNYQPVMSPVPW